MKVSRTAVTGFAALYPSYILADRFPVVRIRFVCNVPADPDGHISKWQVGWVERSETHHSLWSRHGDDIHSNSVKHDHTARIRRLAALVV